jgi:hypothetical protein
MRKGLPKIALLLVFVLVITGIALAIEEPEEPVQEAPEAAQAEVPFTAETPVAITPPGQAPEIAIVSLLAGRINLEMKKDNFLDVDGLEGIKTLIIIIGGSGKGLGSAGVDLQDEVNRGNRVITACKEKGIKIIGMHLGGEDRLGANSMVMIDLVTPNCDYVVVRSDGNKDGLFTKICTEKKIPLTIIEKTLEVTDILKAVFQLPS